MKGEYVFVFGGYSIEKQRAFSDTWKLDLTTGKWSAGQKLLSERHGHRTIQYGFDLLHIGGFGQMPFEKWVCNSFSDRNMFLDTNRAPRGTVFSGRVVS